MKTMKVKTSPMERAKKARRARAKQIKKLKRILGLTIDSDCTAISMASEYAAVISQAISESTTTPIVPRDVYKEATNDILLIASEASWDLLLDNHGDGEVPLHPYAKKALKNQMVKLDYSKKQKELATLIYEKDSELLDGMEFTAFDLEGALEYFER